MQSKKMKILLLSDHAMSTSGVGCQSRFLMNGLIEKGCWTVRQFGAALKHVDYSVQQPHPDFVIKPIDGFGNPDLIRVTLATEKPDVLFIFTDPRFFTWLFEMEDEIKQICPIVWWHVWDNYPFPEFNRFYYEGTDLINCHSHLTYTMIKDHFPEKTNFIPHALPDNLFYPLPDHEIKIHKRNILGASRIDHFTGIWVNRNAKRKRPNDVLLSFKTFLDTVEKRHGHRKATLIMHTEPTDSEGPNLFSTAEMLGIQDNVFFSRDRIDFEKMNILYNISDYCLNISFAEGFGLSTLESMMAGVPIIAAKTGGLTRQVINHKNKTENGVAVNIKARTLVGSQTVPYIYEDYVDTTDVSKAMLKLYKINKDANKKRKLKKKVYNYAISEFGYQKTIDMWHDTMLKTVNDFKENKGKPKWTLVEI